MAKGKEVLKGERLSWTSFLVARQQAEIYAGTGVAGEIKKAIRGFKDFMQNKMNIS